VLQHSAWWQPLTLAILQYCPSRYTARSCGVQFFVVYSRERPTDVIEGVSHTFVV
jgi:hypothetical protein